MRKHLLLALLLAAILLPAAVSAQEAVPGFNLGIDRGTARAIGLDPSCTPVAMGGLSPLGSVLPEDQLAHFAKVMRWKRLTIIALGINTGSLLVAAIEPFVGNILGILSLGFYTISAGYMAFGYIDLMGAQHLTAEEEPDPRPAYLASVLTAGFGMGALTALGLAFESGFAAVLGLICTAASGVSGIVAIIRTNRYAEVIDYQSYAQRMENTGFRSLLAASTVPEGQDGESRFRLAVPLIRYSY